MKHLYHGLAPTSSVDLYSVSGLNVMVHFQTLSCNVAMMEIENVHSTTAMEFHTNNEQLWNLYTSYILPFTNTVHKHCMEHGFFIFLYDFLFFSSSFSIAFDCISHMFVPPVSHLIRHTQQNMAKSHFIAMLHR